MATRSLADALTAAPATAALLARVHASERVSAALAKLAPTPGFNPNQPGRCEIRERTLLLRTTSAAIAAKLRQSLPSMLGGLQRQGFELIEIKVQVQPERTGYPMTGGATEAGAEMVSDGRLAASETRSIQSARDFASKLALTLTDSPLKLAAQRLSRRLDELARTRQPARDVR